MLAPRREGRRRSRFNGSPVRRGGAVLDAGDPGWRDAGTWAALPALRTLDVLDGLAPSALDALLARDTAALGEAAGVAGPALVVGCEALWSTLAPRKLDDAWRRLALAERPPAPRVLLLHSPHFLDRLTRAFDASPQPDRLLRWA